MNDPAVPAAITSAPATKIARPTLITQQTIAAIAAAALFLIFLTICALAWHDWPASTAAQRIDWLGRIAATLVAMLSVIVMSWMLPTNGSEEFTGPGISFKINGEDKGNV